MYVATLMDENDVKTRAMADEAGLSYNTVLSYQRNSSDLVSKRVLQSLASAMGLEVWELFYPGHYARPLTKIAKALDIEVGDLPTKMDEYKAIFMAISDKLGADVNDDDFGPIFE